jgi:hypothetical protein
LIFRPGGKYGPKVSSEITSSTTNSASGSQKNLEIAANLIAASMVPFLFYIIVT